MKNNKKQVEELDVFYKNRWGDIENNYVLSTSKQRRLIIINDIICQYLPARASRENLCVLDYGCGNGWLISKLIDFGFTCVSAFDVTPSVLENLKKKFEHVNFFTGNGTFPSSIPDKGFDFITSIEVIEHIPFSDKKLYINDLFRISNNNALLILTTPNGKWRKVALPAEIEQPVEDWLTVHELRKLLSEAGFKILKIGSKGIYRYVKVDKFLLSGHIKRIFLKLGMWDKYINFLEKLNRGITLYAVILKQD